MENTKTLKRVKDLEAEISELRKILEAPAPAPSLLTKPVPGSAIDYFSISRHVSIGRFVSESRNATSLGERFYDHGNLFQTRELAASYADAIDTMLLLRHQRGTVPDTRETTAWGIDCRVNDEVFVEIWDDCGYRATSISPSFDSRESAEAAITAIGADRILQMFKTLHHSTY